MIPPYILSSVTQIPIYKILGEEVCEFMNSMEVCAGLKNALGGFFMCVYRMILMEKPHIAMNVR